jgi:hypothetical protein
VALETKDHIDAIAGRPDAVAEAEGEMRAVRARIAFYEHARSKLLKLAHAAEVGLRSSPVLCSDMAAAQQQFGDGYTPRHNYSKKYHRVFGAPDFGDMEKGVSDALCRLHEQGARGMSMKRLLNNYNDADRKRIWSRVCDSNAVGGAFTDPPIKDCHNLTGPKCLENCATCWYDPEIGCKKRSIEPDASLYAGPIYNSMPQTRRKSGRRR